MPPRILIVDDLESNRFLLEEALTGLAPEIVSVENGLLALEAVETLEPEVVVLDFQMPGIDGVETSRRIKDREGAPYTYVVLLSGYYEIEQSSGIERSGADTFVRKPHTVDEIRTAVQEGLEITTRRRQG